ncbi:CoA ester lyase [Mesorhizobium sp. M2D.F.Ca.ET.185.01.1.1]|uniref:HpcH/HpaI aldolase/citrate lyase family protein n=1 Tax=unclassified Mesorhizobium TaxID=325217 RepID=UPI000FCCB25E|nr:MULTISPECIES: CoA ester lyase [unclassified Mesorhizobium]TGP75621.1 CoA ester lyase [bacterium M00.F.Ca.ET.227.01.1.1]TGP87102.1 CoA ester lyase [bacterium M00.F.Ca.ET.221.01.1.1]TGP91594.1 CoA ester lyase [bacterium M00.F.Ca.ET.222.01.1.1]TGU04152.1 CoA ester lyase [bacterium M00.F.Ca.ET.163.01.1.1]TGU23352.1 CoA ester lyase [bacterium M00.F.Ca.ET.156.01.1.1]TGU44353.1 CoA ester lyase [bacterium M00.F.Ca.ET.146.01.1.1]TGV67734.1 CoA ester lyase [Mesorhizobium sp. M2D.F.Ca.ET.160.01.1.1]
MAQEPYRPRRSVLYIPASNDKALAKIASLACDAVIIDLEDGVLPADKAAARDKIAGILAGREKRREMVVRINPLASEWGADDLLAVAKAEPDGILLPKIGTPRDILEAGDLLDDNFAPDSVKLWAMVETPKALLNIGAIAELGRDPASRLACFVVGTNDLVKSTGVLATPDRRYLMPWLMQLVLAARAGGLDVIDGVANDFRDLDAFAGECAEGAAMGFDGKSLIHPAQIEAANRAFSPSPEALAQARAIRDAFARPENAGKGIIALDGRMVERLHLAEAEKLLAKAAIIGA